MSLAYDINLDCFHTFPSLLSPVLQSCFGQSGVLPKVKKKFAGLTLAFSLNNQSMFCAIPWEVTQWNQNLPVFKKCWSYSLLVTVDLQKLKKVKLFRRVQSDDTVASQTDSWEQVWKARVELNIFHCQYLNSAKTSKSNDLVVCAYGQKLNWPLTIKCGSFLNCWNLEVQTCCYLSCLPQYIGVTIKWYEFTVI